MKQIKQHLPFLHVLTHCPQTQCNGLVDTSTKDQVNVVGSVCLNMLNGYFILNESDKKALLKYRKRIHALDSKKIGLKTKRKLMRGKFLKDFLKIILPKLQAIIHGKRNDHDSKV